VLSASTTISARSHEKISHHESPSGAPSKQIHELRPSRGSDTRESRRYTIADRVRRQAQHRCDFAVRQTALKQVHDFGLAGRKRRVGVRNVRLFVRTSGGVVRFDGLETGAGVALHVSIRPRLFSMHNLRPMSKYWLHISEHLPLLLGA
jgi:hypothetical protein